MAASAGGWENVSRAAPCAICGKPDWCRRSKDEAVADCYRECAANGIQKTDKIGGVFFRHFLKPRSGGTSEKAREAREEEEQPGLGYEREAVDEDTRDRIYRELIELCGLYQDHARALLAKRGITVEEARALGYCSFPVGADGRKVVDELERRHGPLLLSA
jgi:hypothetical protein